jgi:hypothetical protein
VQKKGKKKKTYVARSCVLDLFFLLVLSFTAKCRYFCHRQRRRSDALAREKKKNIFCLLIVVFVRVRKRKNKTKFNHQAKETPISFMLFNRIQKRERKTIYSFFVLRDHKI